MNGEIPSVPITTLAGIASLTELLPELPLPSPLPHTVNNKSLLFDKNIAEQAKAVLATKNEAVISQLVNALRQTNTDNIELKDNLAGDAIEGDIPQLLRGILAQDPSVFKAGSGSSYNTVNSTGHGSNSQHHGNGNDSLSPHSSFAAGFGGAGTSRFQEQFANFTQQQVPGTNATVNGGSPPVYGHGFKPPQSSPAQATAALLSGDLPHEDQASLTEDRNKHKQLLKSSEPVVLIKPLSEEAIGEATKRSSSTNSAPHTPPMPTSEKVPVVSLRRVDDSAAIAKDKKKNRAHYTVTSPSSGLGITLKISKAKAQEDKKESGKRKRSTDEEDPPNDEDADGYTSGPGERSKRIRRKTTLYQATAAGDAQSVEDDDEEVIDVDSPPDSPFEPSPKELKELKMKEKKDPFRSRPKDEVKPESTGVAMNFADMYKKRMKNRTRVPEAMQSVEELMETPTFKRFNTAIDTVLELAEDMDLAEFNKDDDDDAMGSSESLISRSLLSELANESAKLKSMGVTNQVPAKKLIKVLTILQCNIKDGCRVIRHSKVDDDDDDDEDDDRYSREVKLDKATAAADAALTALYIMTSPNMPKEVFLEEVIDKTIRLTRNQTLNRLYPEFDPVYRIDPKNTTGYASNTKKKRARASGAKNKSVINLYNKITDLIGTLSELIDIQELTDTLILQTSTIAVSPFFVENISELQLNSLKLVTSVFSRYEKHRQLILEDILSSLARLPSSKKNLRNYRLNSDEQIQMVTALALELIQCVVRLPTMDEDDRPHSPKHTGDVKTSKDKLTKKQLQEQMETMKAADLAKQEKLKVDREVIIVTSFETAARTAHNFLTVFLKKCTHKGDEDYRPLFENFVHDLLATVNKPEWPASELLLNLLGRLLVKQFSNKNVDMSLRVASLDYLGIVAARLRKDTVSSKLNEEVIHDIIEQINEEEVEVKPTRGRKSQQAEEKDKTQELQKALLDYLIYNAQNDPALVFARQFYIAMWYRDSAGEIERSHGKNLLKTPEKDKKSEKKKDKPTRRSSRRVISSSESEEEPEVISEAEDDEETKKKKDLAEEVERTKMIQQLAEKRKSFLLTQIPSKMGAFATFKPSPSKLDYDNGCLVTRYLASNRPLSQCFDIYLSQILKVLCETAVAVRTKAMKCLTAVVEADPSLLARTDMQGAVHARLLDQSTSVREAAIELVGKFILIRPELTHQYFTMLSERILDTGISVRKRVIKIFREVCLEQTEFSRIPEMCVKMIRRVNDEEGIKKLVNETFQSMWFSPVSDRDEQKLLTRVMNITDVVSACKDTGHDWFEQLLENLLLKEESASSKPVEKACKQIIKCLVENVLRLEEKSAEGGQHIVSPRLLACFSTLFLFCKVRPELLVPHSYTIQPYLDIKCKSPSDHLVPHSVARILEQAIPLMEHPSESFLATLEEDMMRLILRHGMTVLQSCVSCLGAVVNNVSHNYTLVRDCFQKFFGVLSRVMGEHKRDPTSPQLVSSRPTLLRSLFTVGLLCKHFDFDSQDFGEKRVSVKDKVFEVLLYFITHEDEEVQLKALAGLGFFCVRHYEYMLGSETKELYNHLLTNHSASNRMCCQVLKNIQNYLLEEEETMIKADHEWRKNATKEDLKEMGDLQSGMASTIIQLYLKHVLESFFHSQMQVRLHALSVATLILRQGLVHPVQCVPYLICMGADSDSVIRVKADQQLQEIDKKYPGFIQMKAIHGVKMSYKMQELLQSDPLEPLRGIREEENNVIALNSYIYSLIRSNRGQRRGLLSSMLNSFDDTARTPMKELLYLSDNLAHFPYQHQDEPLFIIHQIDIIVSVSGSNLIQSFKEVFYPEAADQKAKFDDDEDDDLDKLIERLPEDMTPLQEYFLASQGCVLLLVVKQHMKEQYGFTDNKIQRYSPTDSAKMYDKPLNRKHGVKFHPKQALDLLKAGPLPTEVDEEGKVALVQSYLDFKQLMLSIDPDDEDEEDEAASKAKAASQKAAATGRDGEAVPAAGTDNAETSLNKSTDSNEDRDKLKHMDTQDKDDDDDDIAIVEVTPGRRSRHRHQSPPPPNKTNHASSKSTSAYRLSIGNLLEKKRSRSNVQSTQSSHRSRHTPSTPKHKPKKKKRRRRMSDSEEDSDDNSDPDFAL